MIPVEIGEPSPRTALFEPNRNKEELRANLDLVQEAREIAHVKEYAIKARAARKYNQKVIPRRFKTRDLVLKKITMTANKNKLTPFWEGPFRVIDEIGQGAYKLESFEKKALPRTWNAASLRIPITVGRKRLVQGRDSEPKTLTTVGRKPVQRYEQDAITKI
ncbi:hypothetical protein CR513_21249, partial [Mucuna pruriens]